MSTAAAAHDESDEVLVQRSTRGDANAFGTLLSRYRVDLDTFAGRFHRDPLQRDEIVQETMIKAWRNISGFDGRSAVLTWLYRITANTALDWHRRARHQPIPMGDQSYLDGRSVASPETIVVEDHYWRWAIDHLPAHHRAVSVLADRLGCPYREIANLCGVSEATVRVRLARARRGLRAALAVAG